MFWGLMYGTPIAVGVLMLWSLENVRSDYAAGAVFGLIGAGVALTCAVGTHALITVIKRASGRNRERVALMFFPLMKIIQLSSILITLGMGVGLVAASFYLPALLTGHFLPKLTLLMAFAVVYVSSNISRVLMSVSPKPSVKVKGALVGRSDAPSLWAAVDDIARKLNTSSPERIVITLDDTICVTESELVLNDKYYNGRSLILSLLLIKQINQGQFSAIIAHELAHFSGGDTAFSLKFFPIFRGAVEAHAAASKSIEGFGASGIVGIPAIMLTKSFMDAFAEVEAHISRASEKEADIKAAAIAGHLNMVQALIAVHGLSILWGQCDKALFGLLHEEGKVTSNMVNFYERVLNGEGISSLVETALKSSVPHPFNSHPSLQQRIEYLGETVEVVKNADNFIAKEKNPLITSIVGIDALEIELSDFENQRNSVISQYIKAAKKNNASDKAAA